MSKRNKIYGKPKTKRIRQSKRMNGTPVKNTAIVKEPKSLIQSNVKLAALVLVASYFVLDYLMMETPQDLHIVLTVLFTLLAPSTLYSFYVNDYQRGIGPTDGLDMPKFVKNRKKYATFGWLAITIWGIILLIIEPIVVPRFFPILNKTYLEPQIMLMIFIAPVIEEIIFRYLLYDRWLKKKCGWFFGFVIASFIFVICHPVTNAHALVIYWVPTILFFVVYSEFGLYGAIMVHMIYNMMAL